MIQKAGQIIKNGGLCAFPTETVYGLGADAFNETAVKNIFKAKGRPSDNPLIVHISDISMIYELTKEITPSAKILIENFMPGPITIILKKKNIISDVVSAGLDTVAIRCPQNLIARALIKASNTPIAAPSANISGKPSPTKACYVIDDMMGKIDAIIDGGECSGGVESTVVDATGQDPIILRPGIITFDQIYSLIPTVKIDEHVLKSVSVTDIPKCPGMKYKHYAPDAEVIVVEGDARNVHEKITQLLKENTNKKTGVLTYFNYEYNADVVLSAGHNGSDYAKVLFTRLREFDELGVDIVFAEFKETDGYCLAVKNRLYKSAGNNVIKV